ncbi:class I SAM-dependent methyltransferase [Lysobacter sp. CA196]|uniref:class I SAM-dependent methyltransferase n=1 Tax=Lysobacter sp. CA196 TaxID=3455606 RepID=UPI003F8D0580
MALKTRLKRIGKRIPPVYWLGGLVNYLKFRRELAREQALYDAKLRHGGATVPPPMLRYRVHRALDEASFVATGPVVAADLLRCLESQGVRLDGLTVLDFACGPGRVVGEMKARSRNCEFHGSDIDPEAIEWAQRHLSQVARFQVNAPAPPTSYADASFDVIYNVSLFTHLDESNQNVWLEELARILKPGGVLLTTVHGKYTLDSCTPEERAELDRYGIAFRVDHKGRFKLDGLPDFYQTTFHAREYIARTWSRYFDILDHVEGGLQRHHDVVLLGRRAVAAQ